MASVSVALLRADSRSTPLLLVVPAAASSGGLACSPISSPSPLALAIVIASWRDEGQTPGLLALLLIILYAIFALGIIVPALALTVRRLHDAGYSGLLVLLGLIPYLGSLIMLIFVLLPSSPAGVKYDPITATPDPYGPYPPQNLYPG